MFVGATGSDDGDVEGYNGIDVGIYEDVWLAKLDSLGNLTWQYCYSGGGRETICRGVVQKGDFNYVITLGTDTDPWQCGGVQMPDLRVVELYDTTVGVDETVENTIGVEVYPNPAGDFVTFACILPPGTTGGSIEIHNLTGQRVAAIPLNLSEDKVLFDVRELPPGIYFYTLKTARAATTAKLVVTR